MPNRLIAMKKNQVIQARLPQSHAEVIIPIPGYPPDPAGEDIYRNALEVDNLDPEDVVAQKESPADRRGYLQNEKAFQEAVSGNDGDVLGAAWTNQEENLGSTEEENHDYSFSGEGYQNL